MFEEEKVKHEKLLKNTLSENTLWIKCFKAALLPSCLLCQSSSDSKNLLPKGMISFSQPFSKILNQNKCLKKKK